MDDTTMLVNETPTMLVIASEDGQKENASESAALEASLVAFATLESTTEYITEASACQIPAAPTLEEIASEIAGAAQRRIEASLRELNETRARIERERTARESALKAAQERVNQTQAELDGLASERATMERRAETFLAGDALKATMEKIHLAFNVRQLELEDALAVASADVEEMQTGIQAALISDALELQFAAQSLERLETAAPDVANAVRLAASAQENVTAALRAVKEGLLRDAEVLLDKAKAGKAEPAKLADVEQAIAKAKRNLIARDLIARMNAQAEQIGGVRRVRKLIDEATAAGVANQVARSASRALQIAREVSTARYEQAIPIVEHLAGEGFVPVIGDGRIEVWKEKSKNDTSAHAQQAVVWTLDRVMLLRGDVWKTVTPRLPVTRQTLPERVQRSQWFKPQSPNETNPAQ